MTAKQVLVIFLLACSVYNSTNKGFESMMIEDPVADGNMLQDTGDIPVPASATQIPGAAPLESTTVKNMAAPVAQVQVQAPVTFNSKNFV
jgi:hypothetical protein